MIRRPRQLVAAAVLLLLGPASLAAAPSDRKAPTTPTNLRVTARTAYSVSFAWGASTDNSGSFTYRLLNNTLGDSVVVPGTQTAFTSTSRLRPGQTYAFTLYAVDGAGNWSRASNAVSATLPADTTTPGAPQVSLTGAGPTHLNLAFTTPDDDPRPLYAVTMNGSTIQTGSHDPSIIVAPLAAQTTYSFTVRARDGAGHWSPVSTFIATTDPADPNDTTAPTTPTLFGGPIGGCEVMFTWSASSDDVTPPEFIVYRLLVNGVHVNTTTLGRTQMIEYGNVDGPNRFDLIAVDEAGNASAPATATFDLTGCIPF